MDKQIHTDSTSSNIFLTGIMLFANMDFTGYIDYAVKAVIGGAIWLGYKITAEHMDRKKKEK
jgi:hypothetical protein